MTPNNGGIRVTLRDDQVAVLCDIAQSSTLSGAKRAGLKELITEGYVIKDADGHKLTEKQKSCWRSAVSTKRGLTRSNPPQIFKSQSPFRYPGLTCTVRISIARSSAAAFQR
jgi:hypothetical protein